MSAVYRRELKAAFRNMTANIFLAVALIITGVFSVVVNFIYGDSAFESTVSSVAFIVTLVIPILTMRSFAEEKSAKTDTLLYTLPLKMSQIVCAKFFSMFTVFAVYSGITMIYPLIFMGYGKVNFLSALSSVIALLLLGGAIMAIGMFFSSLTESQVIAAVSTFGVILLLYLMSVITYIFPSSAVASLLAFVVVGVLIGVLAGAVTKSYGVGFAVGTVLAVGSVIVYIANPTAFAGAFPEVLSKLSLYNRMEYFMSGIFDLTSVVYYISVTVLFLVFTTQSMDKKRWR